jgi:uncharacterized membrane protein
MTIASNWFTWALFSAVFAALNAIFAKIGLAGVDSDLATLIRTVVIFGVLGAFIHALQIAHVRQAGMRFRQFKAVIEILYQ